MPETVYACVDVEASGPIPDPFNLVSIGAIAVRRQDRPGESASWAVDETSLFYAELRPVYPGFDSEAMAIHGISREHLEKLGIDPAAAMRRLADWALGLGGQPVFVGHNAVFDWAYVNHYFVRTGVANPFGWKALDTKSLAAGVLRLPFLETSKEILAQWLPDLNPEQAGLSPTVPFPPPDGSVARMTKS
jgi:DNA polymerase III epsilon subunit-like protein